MNRHALKRGISFMRVMTHRTRAVRLLIVLGLLLGSLAAFPAVVGATSYVVTECGDAGGANTLRGRLDAANSDANEPHLITFDFAVACPVITLNGSSSLPVFRDMTIQGPGAAELTVSGGNLSGVFDVYSDAATISGLTIAGGTFVFGGGIFNSGTLTVRDAVIRDNHATVLGGGAYNNDFAVLHLVDTLVENNTSDVHGGGIFSLGVLSISNSTISGNSAQHDGAGVHSQSGTLTISDSVVSDNAAELSGGGIYNSGKALVSRTTIADNAVAVFDGGGVANNGDFTLRDSVVHGNAADSFGGGLYTYGAGMLTVINSTIDDNSGGFAGGGLYSDGSATVTNSTIAGNTVIANGGGIGIGAERSLTLRASIVANNTAGVSAPDISGTVTSGGHNLLAEAAGSSGLTHGVNGNLVGVDPLLDVLADNDGSTQTRALLPGSPAVDHIPSVACAVHMDQRGVVRPQNGACEIGAFEVYVGINQQACLFAGALSKVAPIGTNHVPNPGLACGRGAALALMSGKAPFSDTFDDDYYACLFAGSLSQVGQTAPVNCGRGALIALAAGDDIWACLYAGALSQVGTVQPVSCGRGAPVGLAQAMN